MKFTLSTKPLSNALDLGVINANISKFYRTSCLAQLTASKNTLRINLEASFIKSELLLRGSGDSDEEVVSFVDCAVLKSLISTIETSTVTIEFVEGGIVIHSGSSKFNLPSLVDGADGVSLSRPDVNTDPSAATIKLVADDWKFIKSYQLYAAASSFVHPIYTRVWLGADGNVIVGDIDNTLFTFSKKGHLGRTCLLSDTIINLLESLPEGAQITQMGTSYRVEVSTDAFDYAAQFTPQYESEEGVGSYESAIFLEKSQLDPANQIKVSIAPVKKFLSQAELLSSAGGAIELSYSAGQLSLKDDNIDCKVAVEGTCSDFSSQFDFSNLKLILGNIDEETATISPIIEEGVTVGILVGTPNLTVLLGGLE